MTSRDAQGTGARLAAMLAGIGIVAALVLALGAAEAGAATHEVTKRVGPISVDGYEVSQKVSGAPDPNIDGYVTKMKVDIVDEAGTPIPIQRLMLHHIVFLNLAQPDRTCGSLTGFDNQVKFPARERFYAAGEERSKLTLPDGYGYEVAAADNWLMTYMVMNHRATTDTAYIEYTMTVVDDPNGDADPANDITPVTPYWLDVANCRADPIYNVPGNRDPGSVHERTADYLIPEDGRVVAGSGHVHGGAHRLTLSQPDCGNRELAASLPTWGNPEHPFYNVKPILHEPGPINMSAFGTEQGFPVAAGQRLRLNSVYDNSLPHTRVMGIMVVFIAHDVDVTDGCGPAPTDVVNTDPSAAGRAGPIPFKIPLTGLDAAGNAVAIKNPPGKIERKPSGSTLYVGDNFFVNRNVKVKRGANLTWNFGSEELHNVTLANGPIGIGSPNLDGDRTFAQQFRKKGNYRFFCGLHPVDMTQRVKVVGKRAGQRRR